MPTWEELMGDPPKKTWKDIIPDFTPETTQVTSSLPTPGVQVPIENQMQGATGRKYGMDFDPSLYIPDDLPDLNVPENDPELVKEKVHQDYFISEEQQTAINEANTRQPTIYQGPLTDTPPRIDPDLLKPGTFQKGGAGEYLVDKLSNETVMGKASILLAGTIQAAAHGGDPVDYYRDIYDANNQTIMGYKPNKVQDAATSTLAIALDLPVFEGTGMLYNKGTAGVIKHATGYVSDKLVAAGATREIANLYAKNSIVKLNSMLQLGAILGTHPVLNDAATEIAEGSSLDEVNWNQLSRTGFEGGVLGVGLGAFGLGANWIQNSRYYQRMIDGSITGRMAERGFKTGAFMGEVSVLTLGGAMMDENRRWYDTTADEWINNAVIVASLKAMHSRQKLPQGKGAFSQGETEAIQKHTKDLSFRDPLRSLVENEGSIESLMNDKATPYSLKQKVSEMAGSEAPMPLVTGVEQKTRPDGRSEVSTYDKNGVLLQRETFNSEAEGYSFYKDIEQGKDEASWVQESSTLKLKYQIELDKRLEKAGVEGGITNEDLQYAVSILPSERSPAAKALAAKFFDTYDAFKTEKTEVKEGETAEKIFKGVDPDAPVPGEINVEEVLAKAEENVKKYTPEDIDLKYEPDDRLDAKINHPREGINKILSDIQQIRESGNFKDAVISSKTMRNYFPEVQGETMKIKTEAKLNKAEKVFTEAKAKVEAELARRTHAGEPSVATGNFVLGRKGFETKAELYKELDKFPSMDNAYPEAGDFETAKAIIEYEALRDTKSKFGAKGARVAETIRSKKGLLKPGEGELQVRLPYMAEAVDLALEIAARAVDAGVSFGEATKRAIDGVKSQAAYGKYSRKEQERIQKAVLDKLGEVYEDLPTDKDVSYVTSETSDKFADLTIAQDGDYVFYHYSGEVRETIRPSEYGSNKANITSAAEAGAMGTVGGISQYYTTTSGVEPGTGRNRHEVKVAKEKVYDGNKDPLNFREEAKRRFKEENPDLGYSPNHQMAWITKIAGENGYDMVLVDWKGKTRAQTTKELIPEVEPVEATRASELGYKKRPGVSAEDVYTNVLKKIGAHQNKLGKFDDLYRAEDLYSNTFNEGKSELYQNRDKVTELVKNSDLPEALKAEYEMALRATDVPGISIQGKPPAPPKPPKTAKQKTVDAGAEGKAKRQKVLVDQYAALKDQIKTQAVIGKDIAKIQKETRQQIMDTLNSVEWQKNMGVRATKTMARRLAAIDPNNPGSVIEALDYIEKVVNDAKFRQEQVEIDKAYETLDKKTAPASYQAKDKQSGVLKGKGMTPESQDVLKATRKNMTEGDWKVAQEEIRKLQEELSKIDQGDPALDGILEKIDELNFHGMLNELSLPTLTDLNSRIADIESIRKEGRTVEAARRFIARAEKAERIEGSFNVLNAGKRNVQLDPERAANLKTPNSTKVSRWLDWSNLDSWFTLLDKMSRFDRSSSMFKSYLSKSNSEPVFKAEREEFLGKEKQLNSVNNKVSEIYDTANPDKLKKILDDNTKADYEMKWTDASGKQETLPISQNQAYKRWMELQDTSLKPSLTKQGYFDQFGERTAKYDALEGILTPEARKWAEWQLNEFYPEYSKLINETYRTIYGTDMPIRDQYSPIFVADKIIDPTAAVDQMFDSKDVRGMAGNNHLKLRTGHAKELLLLDGDKVLMNYINKMEFFRNWAEPLRQLNQVFGDRTIKESIRQNFGQDYVDAVDFFLKQAARDPKKLNKFEKASNKMRTNFTLASLAIKPTVFAKQLTSFPAYADRIPIAEFAKGMADWANPAKWGEVIKLLNDSPYLQERYKKGWDRDVALAMQKDAQSIMAGKGNNWKNKSMFLTKYGDKGAIMFGGWPVYKYHRNNALKQGATPEEAHQAGLREFEFATRQAQQATGPMDLSIIQNSNPIMKWATMYKTSPLQYHRKVVSATRDLVLDHRNPVESAKTLLIYHAVLPQLFQLVGNGFQWDGEDQLRALKWGSATGVPMAGDALRGIVNHVTNTGYRYKPTVLTDLFGESAKAVDEVVDIISGGLGEDPTFDDIWEAINHLSKASGSWTGTPVDAVHNTVSGVADAMQGETSYPMRRILGWSEHALEDDRYDLLRDLPEDALKRIQGKVNNQKKSWKELLEEEGNPSTWDDLIEK